MRIDPAKTQKEPTYQVVLDALALTTCYHAFLITADVPEIYIQQFWLTINKKDSTTYRFKIDKKSYIIDMEMTKLSPLLRNLATKEMLNLSLKWSLIICTNHEEPLLQSSTSAYLGKLQVLRSSDSQELKFYGGMFYKKNVDFVELLWEDFTFQIENIDHKKQEKMYYPRFTKFIIHHFITKDKSFSTRNIMFMHTARDDSILGTMRFISKSEDFQIYGSVLPNMMTNQQIRDSDAYTTYLAYATGAASPKMKRKLKKPASPSKKRTLVTVEEEEPEPAKKDKPTKKPATKRQSSRVQIRHTPGMSVSKKKAPAKIARSKGIELLSDVALLEEAQLKRALKRSKRETTSHQAGGSSKGASFELEVPDEPKGKSIDISEGTSLKPGVPDVSTADCSESKNESWGDSSDEANEQGDDERTKSDDKPTDTDNPKTSDDEEETEDEFVHTPTNFKPTDDETNDESNDVTEEEYERINEELYGDVNVSLTDVEPDDEDKGDKEMTNADTEDAEHENVIQKSAATTFTTAVFESKTLAALQLRVADLEKDVKELKDVDNFTKVILTIQSEVPKAVKTISNKAMHKKQVPKETITSSDTTALAEFDQNTTLFEKMIKSKSFNKSLKQRALYHALMESILEDENAMDEGVAEKLKKRKPDDADKDEGPFTGSDRGKYAQAEKTVFEAGDTQEPQNQGQDMGNTDDQPNVKADPKHDWFKKPKRPPTLDSNWNVRKTVDFRPPQTRISKIAQAKKPSLSFDELMSTPIDFSVYVMKYPKIDNLTQDHLVGPVFNLLKGTCKSRVELEYNIEDCRQVVPVDYFFNNDLEYIRGRSSRKKYTTSTTKTKATKYDILGIEDMVPSLWNPVKKKLNITMPETFKSDISNMIPYATYNNPQGIIYEDKYKRNRLMRTDELYRFSNGILTSVRTVLYDIASNLRMDYLPKRTWSGLDRKRSRIMIKAIDQLLLERRLMRSLEKFVGGRNYREDLKLLEQTI
ncbi:hypothetical protein Tco_1107786 [Tanacetum coccineum]